MEVIDLELQGHFCNRILGNSVCSHDNSSQTQVKITKYAPKMHPGILSAVIEKGVGVGGGGGGGGWGGGGDGGDVDLQDQFGHFDLEF